MDLKFILSNYLAMSEAYPFLQSGSCKDLFFNSIIKDGLSKEIEATTAVGTFLTWDEFGGYYYSIQYGVQGLSQLLDTNRFHSHILKKDLFNLFGQEIKPNYSTVTLDYLKDLYSGLASVNHVQRIACMTAFERHAQEMISALWSSLKDAFPNNQRQDFKYFEIHVGGDDPAEKYHVEMTKKLMEICVSEDKKEEFEEQHNHYYQMNRAWCEDLLELATVSDKEVA